MAKKSIVRIQGTGVPGGAIDVEVPVDHTFATDFAERTYDYPDAQFMWIRSWDTEELARDQANKAKRAANGGDDGCALAFGYLAAAGIALWAAFWFAPYVLGGTLGYFGAKAGKKDGWKMALVCSVILGGGGFIVADVIHRVVGAGAHYVPTEQPAAAPAATPAPSAPAAPSQPAPVVVPNRSARPVYARTEPPVTPVWEMEEDLTGNPDFTFND